MLSQNTILNNVLDSETVHGFFEGVTQKKPRSDDEDCASVASLHIEAFESLLKCVNSKAVGLGSIIKDLHVKCDASVTSLRPGGGRQVIRNLPMGDTCCRQCSTRCFQIAKTFTLEVQSK